MRPLYLFFPLLFLQACQLPKPAEESIHRPNILLIMADDLGWGDVGFNGNTFIQTRSLDSLAARGVLLDRFYSASAVCSPTRASCLTGRNPFRQGILTANAGHLKKEEITLAEILQEQGYATGHFGKWHLGTLTTQIRDSNRGAPGDSTHYSIPTEHGFDEYFSAEAKTPTFDPMLKPLRFDTARGESLRYGWAALTDTTAREPYGTYYWNGPEQQVTENLDGDDSRIIMDRIIPFIEKAARDQQPFFSVVWFHTPHLPVVADAPRRDQYGDLSHEEQLYYGAITAMDEQVGRLWKTLEDLGVSENTMIWFCSDNGPEDRTPGSAGPYRERKRSLYEGGVRVPAFFVYPRRIKRGQQTAVPMVTSDYLPTVLDFLGLSYPDPGRPLDGVSTRSILQGERQKRESPIGFQFGTKTSWVDDRYKLISTDKGQTYELYDLLADPAEEQNVIGEHPEIAERMKRELLDWIASCRDSWEGADYVAAGE